MDHRLLLYFTTLVDKGTFTQAAKALHISQPSLSSAIKKLEDNMGLSLFERSTRKISLTREGEILYKESNKLLNHFEHVQKEMTRLKNEGPLELKIGTIESVKFWLPKVIVTYRESNPEVHIKLLEVLGLRQVETALQNYKIHLAITNQHFENDEILTVPIYKENLVALFPKGHRLQHIQAISINDLEEEEFIICKEGFQTRQDILNAFRKTGINPNIHFEIERFETACSLVEEGLGITIVPENYIKSINHSAFSYKRITNANLSRTVYIACLKNRYLPPVIEQFINITNDFFEKSIYND
ncbi:LysR family transcriptional regulator [Pseudogracilibacillus auburnensis]|uniref:DNA-binding transcriptional LysR family regulator n=1 Tax=Pseudogracilibacillus auburnensis TaxID=1494959 RepID=A0A2V3W232_9BACI|nr:LysR family transcriptional regulator [Pseudogracilibacillus auburnensis]MBO1004406.1 LysR family transcriptional regulator [Pseudogracilibacillus auburnensis]PXW87141.1 DNA-binding transcriptional LysR family regulator [Pseudogracilibacillus auburnensis]